MEFLLSLGVALNGEPGVYALAGDTADGVDGQEETAGASSRRTRPGAPGNSACVLKDRLDDNDGHGFFSACAYRRDRPDADQRQ